MAAYRRVYDSCLLSADCPGSAFFLCADNCSIGTAWQHRHHRCHGNVNTTMAHSLTHKSAGARISISLQTRAQSRHVCIYRLVLSFWYRLTRVVPDKGPLNGCVCVSVSLHTHTHRRTLVIHTVCGVPTQQGHRVSVLAHVPQRQRSVLSAGRHDVRLRGMNVDAVKRHSITRADTLPHA